MEFGGEIRLDIEGQRRLLLLQIVVQREVLDFYLMDDEFEFRRFSGVVLIFSDPELPDINEYEYEKQLIDLLYSTCDSAAFGFG